jgi:hypothetical protein
MGRNFIYMDSLNRFQHSYPADWNKNDGWATCQPPGTFDGVFGYSLCAANTAIFFCAAIFAKKPHKA